jgi:hypothetical protein
LAASASWHHGMVAMTSETAGKSRRVRPEMEGKKSTRTNAGETER